MSKKARQKPWLIGANKLSRWINERMDDAMDAEHHDWPATYRTGLWNAHAATLAQLSKYDKPRKA